MPSLRDGIRSLQVAAIDWVQRAAYPRTMS